jgi:hypothetical protein
MPLLLCNCGCKSGLGATESINDADVKWPVIAAAAAAGAVQCRLQARLWRAVLRDVQAGVLVPWGSSNQRICMPAVSCWHVYAGGGGTCQSCMPEHHNP